MSNRILYAVLACGYIVGTTACSSTRILQVSFSQSADTIAAYDYIEVAARVSWPPAPNPFTDASFSGWFESADKKKWHVDGFCDSEDGRVYRVRYMPATPGDYAYKVECRRGWLRSSFSGKFHVVDRHRRGPIRVDASNRWHFIWEGTGEHYFFNGSTAYWLMGWKDDRVIRSSIRSASSLEDQPTSRNRSGKDESVLWRAGYGRREVDSPA